MCMMMMMMMMSKCIEIIKTRGSLLVAAATGNICNWSTPQSVNGSTNTFVDYITAITIQAPDCLQDAYRIRYTLRNCC